MPTKDWNSVSQSGSDSEPTPEQEEKQTNNQKTIQKQPIDKTQQHPQQHQIHKQIPRQRPKFITDEQLIQQIKNKSLDQRRKIKIINCRDEELAKKVQTNPLVSYFREIKKQQRILFYIACFKTQSDLITFVEEKIKNKYRFYLQPYIKTARDIEREKQRENTRRQRYEEEDREREKQNTRPKQQEDGRRRRNRPDYQQEQNQPRERKRQQNYERTRQPEYKTRQPEYKTRQPEYKTRQPEYKTRQPQRKVEQYREQKRSYNNEAKGQNYRQNYNQKYSNSNQAKGKQQTKKTEQTSSQLNYTIDKNIITIKQNKYSKRRIVQQIVNRKIKDDFVRIKIYVKKDGLDKVLELSEMIYQKIKYGLKELPKEDTTKESDLIEVVLVQGFHKIYPNAGYKLLTGNQKKYFKDCDHVNKYLIVKEFNSEEYIKKFKQFQKQVSAKWSQWFIKAEDESIPQVRIFLFQLLKLSWKLRKELYVNVNIRVGSNMDKAFAILQIQPQVDKDKRPKVDTSYVNSYLAN